MQMVAGKTNLLNLGIQAMQDYVHSLGQPKYRAEQLIQWIHQKGEIDFARMSNLSQSFRQHLVLSASIEPLTAMSERVSQDGTHKWLLRLADNNAIETVFIPEPDRGTLCISSQVGCGLNCSFCATGKEGFNRNLSLAEIIGQVWFAKQQLAKSNQYKLTNVVMMGMGEPLLNYQPVIQALELMMHDLAYGLSKYRVTVSTSGLIPAMQQLKKDSPASLAVSLHAANDALRDQLVPLNKKYPLAQLLAVCRDYFPAGSKRVVTFEYVMLAGINDSLQDAQQLRQLIGNMPCKINLIPFNSFPGTRYQRSSEASIDQFQQYLMKAGIACWVRRTRGDDIEGACGQLAGDFKDRTGRHQRWLKTGRIIPVVAE